MSARTGPHIEIHAAVAIANTNVTAMTTFKPLGNSTKLIITTTVGGCVNLTFTAETSQSGEAGTYADVIDRDSVWSQVCTTPTTAGVYELDLEGLQTIPGYWLRLSFQANTAAGTLGVWATNWENPKGGGISVSAPDIIVDIGNIDLNVEAVEQIHGDAVGASGFMQVIEAKTVDGAVLPNAVTEGQVVRPAAEKTGNVLTTIVDVDGSDTPVITEDVAKAAGIGTAVVMAGNTVADRDGAAIPTLADTQGKAVSRAASQQGVAFSQLTTPDGASTPLVSHDEVMAAATGGDVGLTAMAEAETLAAISTVTAAGDATRIKASTSGILHTALTDPTGADDVGTAIRTAVEIIDDWDETHGSAVGADGSGQMLEAKDIDGGALDNIVAEGQAVRQAGTLSGGAIVTVTDEAGLYAQPTGDALARSIFTAIGDATTTAVVETDGTKKALNVNVTDGTNDQPTMDDPARRGYQQLTDGTTDATVDATTAGLNTNLAGYAGAATSAANPIDAQLGDGTSQVNIHDATALVIDDAAANDGLQTASLLYGYDDTGAAETWRAAAVNASGNLEVDVAAFGIGVIDVQGDDAHDDTFDANPLGIGAEAETIGALGTVTADGDISRVKASRSGVLYGSVVNADGSKELVQADDAAFVPDSLGLIGLTVRQDDADTLSSANGDLTPMTTSEHGCLNVDAQHFYDVDDMNATTGWTALSNDTITIATTTNHVFGTTAVEFDKTDGLDNTVFGAIQKTITSFSANKHIEEGGGYVFWDLYISAVANVAYSFIRLGTDATNYNEWRVDDDDLAAGWNNIRVQLTSPSAVALNGWDSSAVVYCCVGVAFDAETDALADIAVDHIHINSGMQVSADITSQTSTSINTPNINLQRVANTPVTVDQGNSTSNTQRVAIADDDTNLLAITTAVEIIDNVVYAEDSGHTTADPGVHVLGVRNDSRAVATDVDADYISFSTDSTGAQHVSSKLSDKPLIANATGAAAIAFTTSISAAFEVDSITLHLSAADVAGGNFTMGLDADLGAAYDTNLFTLDLSTDAVVDLVLTPEQDGFPKLYGADDELAFAWINTNARTYGLRVTYRLV